MDSIRSAEKSRRKSRKLLQDYKLDQFNFGNQEVKSVSSSRFDSIKTSPELDTIPKHWAIVSEGFPPGVTVDELKKYGRRKPLHHLRPQDNLRLEEGSLKAYKSEYKRKFLPFSLPKVFPISEENSEETTAEDVDSFSKYKDYFPPERPISLKPPNNLFILKDQPMETLTEKNSSYIQFPHYERRKLLRRSTALRPEGEITCETEVRKEYVDFKNPEKVRLIRKLPSLKLEGEYEPLTTEQRDKYITYLLSKRPVLEKKKTSLRMEGDFDFQTEKKLSYVPHEFSERPRIRKRSTSLKLEGEVEFSPEYKNNFVDFPRTRPLTYKPNERIRQEGDFENQTETKTQFVNFESVPKPPSAKPENNLHMEGEMEISPEYRNNFVDFPRERPLLRRPFNQLKPEGNLELMTESSEKFSNVGVIEKLDGPQRSSDVNAERDLNLSSENFKTEIPIVVEPPKESLDSKLGPEMDLTSDKFGFLVPERKITNRRPLSLRQDREFFFSPDSTKFYTEHTREKNLKLTEDVKSNTSSPRKKAPREKIKSNLEEDKKSNPETFRRKSSVKRLKEARTPEKDLGEEFQEENKREFHQIKQNLRFSESPPTQGYPPKEYQAFKVLDVKGQKGCQSMLRDSSDNEKLTSDEENPTYRLEVSNSEDISPGFHKNNRRVFPELAIDSKLLEEAEIRAKQRAESYVKVVKSPVIPNCLLEQDSDAESMWKVPDKLYPLSPPENTNERSFVVLDQIRAVCESPVATPTVRKETKGWLPDSIDSLLS